MYIRCYYIKQRQTDMRNLSIFNHCTMVLQRVFKNKIWNMYPINWLGLAEYQISLFEHGLLVLLIFRYL